MVDTRPVIPLTNAQLLLVATRSLVGWGVILTGALLPMTLLSVNPIISIFSVSHTVSDSHGKGWILAIGWLVFGIISLGFGQLIDSVDRFKTNKRSTVVVSLVSLVALTVAIPKTSILSLGLLLILLQIPSAVLATLASTQLSRAKEKTGRGSASAIFALSLSISFLVASQITEATNRISGVNITVGLGIFLIAIGFVINLWLKKHPGKPVRHRISRHDKKKINGNHFIRFYIANVVFFAGVYAIDYYLPAIANSNANKKGVALDQIVSASISLYTVGSLAAVFATVFFLFATERIERTYLVGTIMFGVATLMLVSMAKASIFVLIRSLSGVAVGITSTTLLVLTITYLPKKSWRGRAVGLLFSSLALSHIAGPALGHFLIRDEFTGSAFTPLLMTFAIGSCVTAGILHVTRAKPNDFHVSM